jgi:hypothetical protein
MPPRVYLRGERKMREREVIGPEEARRRKEQKK